MPYNALPIVRTLQPGRQVVGDDVFAVSRLLKQEGLRSQRTTRQFGPRMSAQTKAFQKKHGLGVTGNWGPTTHAAAAKGKLFDQFANVLLGNVSAPLTRELKTGKGMTGGDVDAVARALWRLEYRTRRDGLAGVKFGLEMSRQTKRFQSAQKLQADGVWGQRTHDRACALVAFDDLACALLRDAADHTDDRAHEIQKIRSTIVSTALYGYSKRDDIHYTQTAKRMQGVREKDRPPEYPNWEDCSSYATWCYWVAGAPDPNGLGYNGYGFTGTATEHGRRVSSAIAGDLVFYNNPISHVAVAVSGERVVSHGSEPGPLLLPLMYRSDFNHIRRYVE